MSGLSWLARRKLSSARAKSCRAVAAMPPAWGGLSLHHGQPREHRDGDDRYEDPRHVAHVQGMSPEAYE